MKRSAFDLATLALAALLLAAAGPVPPERPRPARPAPERPPAEARSEHPPLTPTQDAMVIYHLAPATGEAIDVRVILQAAGRGLRIDLPDGSYMVARPPEHDLVLVVPIDRTATELPWEDGPQPLFLLTDHSRFTRKAEATIAGQRCTMWESMRGPERHLVCVTNTGVVLHNEFQDARGRRSQLDAVAVGSDPVQEADFIVPIEFERLVATPGPGPRR